MSRLGVSTGGDPYAHLRTHLAHVPAAAFEGRWATIEIQPDAFARQRYSVGVLVCDSSTNFVFRMLDDLSAFECMYRGAEIGAIRTLIDAAEQSLLRAQRDRARPSELSFDADGITLGELWATSGDSPEAILSRLYADVIPFIPRSETRDRTFVTLDNAAVRAQVSDALKRIAHLAYEKIVTESQGLIVDRDTGETHLLDFNLTPPGKVGSVISAVYKTQSTIELNYFRAATDLATFRSLRRAIEPGIFVMQPAEGSMAPQDFARVEEFLDEQSWRLEQQGFVVATHDSPAALAQDIWEWSGLSQKAEPSHG